MRFSISQIAPQAWKNGGGSTQELARGDGDAGTAQMIWRASLAQIDQDGPFSTFPGLSRIHCIVAGAGLQLSNGDYRLSAKPLDPLYFDGGLDLEARLKEGPCTAFNLIYEPNLIRPEMQICEAGTHRLGDGAHLVFALTGKLRLDLPEAEICLGQGDGWHGDLSGLVEIAPGSRAVLVGLELI